MAKREQDPPLTTAPPRLLTRRVLLGLGSVVGPGALATGGIAVYDRRRRTGRPADASIRDHRIVLPAGAPGMVIARGLDPARSVRAAVERMGGMSLFVGPTDTVLVKPNIGWDRTPEQGANTHPEVVAEVVRLCHEARAKRVIVCDCPVGKARSSFERSGILAAAHAAGAGVILPEDSHYRTVTISQRLGTWDVLDPFVLTDKIINVPVAKRHALTGVNCGLKNWFGITAKARLLLHQNVQRAIAELAVLMRPTLTIVDASRLVPFSTSSLRFRHVSGGSSCAGWSPRSRACKRPVVASTSPVSSGMRHQRGRARCRNAGARPAWLKVRRAEEPRQTP